MSEKIDLEWLAHDARAFETCAVQADELLALVRAVRAARAYMTPSRSQDVWLARRERLALELTSFTDSAEVRSDGT